LPGWTRGRVCPMARYTRTGAGRATIWSPTTCWAVRTAASPTRARSTP
jgi:hypothetical protein